MKKNDALAPKTSPRPMKRPADAGLAPKTSPRPPPRPQKNPMTGNLESEKDTKTRIDSYSDYYKKGGVVKKAMGGTVEKMATGQRPGSQNVAGYELRGMNSDARRVKDAQKDAESPGVISGFATRVKRDRQFDKAYDLSDSMIDQYGGDAAKSRGFMEYDKRTDPPKVAATNWNIAPAGKKPVAKLSTDKPKTPAKDMPVGSGRGGVTKKAKGGSVRGTGCATRGITGAKQY